MGFPPFLGENYIVAIQHQRTRLYCASKHGVRDPIWLYEGKILDGRHRYRYRAATAMGVQIETREYIGADPAAFVVSLNLHRRHLSESQGRQ